MISLVNVYLRYTKEFYALSNISFEVNKGEVVSLVGPKDSGKTCIMRILAGLEQPTKGEVYIKNIPLKKVDYSIDVSMGYLPYKTCFLEKKTVFDNLKYILDVRKSDRGRIQERINQVVIDFNLENILNEKICNLTNYEKYLVSIARLSFRELEVVLIDNIFEELSQPELKEILKLIKKYLIKPNSAVLIATSSEDIAKELTNRQIFLKYGTIEKVEKKGK